MSNKTFFFTTSWDDGSVLDLKLAELLSRYGVKGTFYIPRDFSWTTGKFSEYGRRLNSDEIKILGINHEIGAHSLTHRLFNRISGSDLEKEVEGSKKFIEETTGQAPEMFCYPGGVVTSEAKAMIQKVGYVGARTTAKLEFDLPNDKYEMPVSVQCVSFPFRKKDANHIYWGRLLDPIRGYPFLKLISFGFKLRSWQSFARAALDRALKQGNCFHLMGHSWELEKYDLWDDLEKFLKYASQKPEIKFVTNSEIARALVK